MESLITPYIYQEIIKAFRIQKWTMLQADIFSYLDEDGKSVRDTIDRYWLVAVKHLHTWSREGDIPKKLDHLAHHGLTGPVYVTIIYTKRWCKGVILMEPIFEPFERKFAGPHPLYPVDLSDFNDPVTNILQNINIFPKNTGLQMNDMNKKSTQYEIEFVTGSSRGRLATDPFCEVEQFELLGDAIDRTTLEIAERCGDAEMLTHLWNVREWVFRDSFRI